MATFSYEMFGDVRGDNKYVVKVDGVKVGLLLLLHENDGTFWTAWVNKKEMVVKKKMWLEAMNEFKRFLNVDENEA